MTTKLQRSGGVCVFLAALAMMGSLLVTPESAARHRPRHKTTTTIPTSTTTSTTSTTTTAPTTTTTTTPPNSASPPGSQDGKEGFADIELARPGSWSTATNSLTSLPSGAACQDRVHRSSWEPRSLNSGRNNYVAPYDAWKAELSTHVYSRYGTYDTRWDSYLMPRVDGNFRGRTDEILQWAACKWGLDDDLVRAVAFRESTWYQYTTYDKDPGRCIHYWGCGDVVGDNETPDAIWCETAATKGGYDYRQDYSTPDTCPGTFSIMGVRAQDRSRADFADHSRGVFPFNRNSTAFAADFFAAWMRGCYEGWQFWLKNTGRAKTGENPYAAGDMYGCIGSWYAGAWRTDAANAYADKVYLSVQDNPWLTTTFYNTKPTCNTTYGCAATTEPSYLPRPN